MCLVNHTSGVGGQERRALVWKSVGVGAFRVLWSMVALLSGIQERPRSINAI